MDQQKLLEQTKENLDWLVNNLKGIPEPQILEPSFQTVSVVYGLLKKDYTSPCELLMLSMAGFVLSKMRIIDESKITSIPLIDVLQYSYLIVKAHILKEEPSEEEFKAIIQNFYK